MNISKNESRLIQDAFKTSGISINEKQLEQFREFFVLLRRYNDELDLSRLKKTEDIIYKHFIDSAIVSLYADLPRSMVDIGTGAGFPGIPLKIIKPDIQLILAEPRAKRVRFMHMAIDALQLEGIEIYPHLVTDISFFDVSGVITRALESVDLTLTRVHHFLVPGGKVIFLKGPGADADRDSVSDLNNERYSLIKDIAYDIPGTSFKRRLVQYRKESNSRTRIFPIMKSSEESPGRPITSDSNARFKTWRKAMTVQGIKKQKRVQVSGKKIILELTQKGFKENDEIVLPDGYTESDQSFLELLSKAIKEGKLFSLKKSLCRELDISTGNVPVLFTDLPEIPVWDGAILKGCSLCVPFQDPSNVGAIIRSAMGFGISEIILTEEAANPFHPRSIRSSAGSVFSAPIVNTGKLEDFIQMMVDSKIPVIALDSRGKEIQKITFPEKFVLVPGIEGPGLPDNVNCVRVSIPMTDSIESYNAMIAASCAMYEWRREKPFIPLQTQ